MSISIEEVERAMRDAGICSCCSDKVLASLYRSCTHEGAGMFVRALPHYPEYADKHLDWISVCVLKEGRIVSRDTAWWAARRDAGLQLSAWDWFPDPDNPTKNLEQAIQFAAEQGCTSFILNAEKAFRGRPRPAAVYAGTARGLCDRYGLLLGLVSYSVPDTVRDFPWDTFAKYCDFGVPEIYDRQHQLDPDYPERAYRSWLKAGFKDIVFGCAIYRGRRSDSGWVWRWRTPEMVADHLDLFPEDMRAWIAWPLAGKPPEPTLRALAVE